MPGIDAGRLNRRVEIQAETRVPNGQGGFTTAWATIANGTVWAEIIGLSGSEARSAMVERNVQQWRITIRRRDEVTSKHRLKQGAILYNIRSALPDPNADDALVIIAETVAVG